MCKKTEECSPISAELERCKNDFVYFFNNYTSVGKQHPLKVDDKSRFFCNVEFLVDTKPITKPRRMGKRQVYEKLRKHIYYYMCKHSAKACLSQ